MLILGGGLGGMSAAWGLSRTQALRDTFEVTLVQPGWRLGGKCASGRQAGSGRIHEHGLHMFMGWYEHAFYMLREVYGDWPNPGARMFPTAQDAFLPLRRLYFGRPGSEDFWDLPFMAHKGYPGDDPNGKANLIDLAVGVIDSLHRQLKLLPPVIPASTPAFLLVKVLEALAATVKRSGLAAQEAYKARVLIEICTAALTGIAAAGMPANGPEVINHLDFRDWLTANGATTVATDSAVIKALYDLAFAYPGGDETTPAMEAGSMLHAALQMAAGYRDAPVYRMRAGMGDVVFAPLYEVLKARGVKFRFFHRAKSLTLSVDKSRVATVTLQRQVDLAAGLTDYDPLINCPVAGKDLHAWPDEPVWAQLSAATPSAAYAKSLEMGGPEVATETLSLGTHFDEVVLAIPLGGDLGVTLAAADAHWAAMRGAMKTVATESVQLWTTKSVFDMGWAFGPTVLAAFAPPLSDWADMSHLLPIEGATGGAQGLIYLCGVATDPTNMAVVYDGLSDWLDAHCQSLWPKTAEPAGFRYDTLVGGSLDTQYVRVNAEGSERYVLSVPKSSATRIAPGATGFKNLCVAGDWVLGDINGGCAEGAVQGGHDAADALILRVTGVARAPYPPVA